MLAQLTPKERFGYLVVATALLFGFGYAGAQYLKKGPDLRLEPLQKGQSLLESAEPQEVVVHVAGAVNRPGLLRMAPGKRVQDALVQAGGAKPNADLEEINLAAKLVDGTQLLVPRKGASTAVPEAYKGGGSDAYRSQPKGNGAKSTPASGSVSLNTATASDLDRLPGVGPATASKILEYRRAHGGFSSIEELLAVKGIGAKKLAAMRKYLRL